MENTTLEGWALILGFVALTALMAKPFGRWLFAVYEGRRTFAHPVFAPIERLLYKAGGVDPEREQGWRGYAVAMLLFNVAGIALLFALQRLQGVLPLNPQGFEGVATPVAFNTAVSFVTNTNWQSYGAPRPDAGADGPELRLRRHRNCRRLRADPRLRAA
jgi:potassium-transporting ATPase potassium-binding subunit